MDEFDRLEHPQHRFHHAGDDQQGSAVAGRNAADVQPYALAGKPGTRHRNGSRAAMSNPTSITITQNADGSYDLPAITLVPYVAPVPPPSPPVSPPPVSPPPPPPATGGTNIGAIQQGDTWAEPTGD